MRAFLFLPAIFLALCSAAEPPCQVAPDYRKIHLLKSGLPSDLPSEKWTQRSAGTFDLLVNAEGPEGSGRYWTVSVGVGSKGRKRLLRGASLRTSTVGWRTLLDFKHSPLPWINDLDADGKAELIVWSSFPLRDEATAAEFGLMAWVYRVTSKDKLEIDWKLSGKMAREIAAAYRTPIQGGSGQLRDQAAAALQTFADGRCQPPAQPAR